MLNKLYCQCNKPVDLLNLEAKYSILLNRGVIMGLKKLVGKRVQEYRKQKSYTQDKLAEMIGIDTVSLSKIETGKNYPSPDTLKKIADALGINIYELFIQNTLKTNEDILKEIFSNIEKIKTDNIKLHTLLATVQTLATK